MRVNATIDPHPDYQTAMTGEPSVSLTRRFYRWSRDLHLYLGLFISPFLLVYAVSAILLNHAYLPGGDAGEESVERWSVPIVAPDEEDGLALAVQIREQIGVTGEIGWISRNEKEQRVSFPIEAPGWNTRVRVDLAAGTAEIEQQRTGLWSSLIYLHKMPGPHNVHLRGNWFVTNLWGWLANATVYLILLVTASGIYLWSVIRSERRIGLLMLGAGAGSFALLIGGLIL